MNIRKTIASLLFLTAAATAAIAQQTTDLRIAEVLVDNETGLVDDYGQRNGWIEVFNNSNGTVKFAGCYLSDDKNNLKKYHIPTQDAKASVGPRQTVVFYASGDASQGTFYTNFKLRKGTTVYLVSNDGRTIVDQIDIPSDLQADKSVKKIPVGVKEQDFKVENNSNPTPGSYNGDLEAKTKSQIMHEKDPWGLVLALISILTVFIALLCLAFIFGWFGNMNKRAAEPKQPKQKKVKAGKDGMTPEVAAAISMALSQEYGMEVYAAIALALDACLGGVHDEESFVITINPTPGSQWNGKTQNFRRSPR